MKLSLQIGHVELLGLYTGYIAVSVCVGGSYGCQLAVVLVMEIFHGTLPHISQYRLVMDLFQCLDVSSGRLPHAL